MTPSHAIFREVFGQCLEITDRVFDYVPGAEEKYPFIFIGENQARVLMRTDYIADIELTAHIWGKRVDRAEIDDWNHQIYERISNLTFAYDYHVALINFESIAVNDNSTGEPLIHNIIELGFRLTKKEREHGEVD